MSIFDAYDSEFSALSSDISKNISDFRTYSSSNKGALLDISVDRTNFDGSECVIVDHTLLIFTITVIREVCQSDEAHRRLVSPSW